MDEKMYELLFQEIDKGLESLKKDQEQINQELQQYRTRNFEQGIKELEQDLAKIELEIDSKKREIETAKRVILNMDTIKNKDNGFKSELEKLLKEKEECEARLNEIGNRLEVRDGVFVESKEVQELKTSSKELDERINSILKNGKENHENLINNKKSLDELMEKYNIHKKYNDTNLEQDSESELWESWMESEKEPQLDTWLDNWGRDEQHLSSETEQKTQDSLNQSEEAPTAHNSV